MHYSIAISVYIGHVYLSFLIVVRVLHHMVLVTLALAYLRKRAQYFQDLSFVILCLMTLFTLKVTFRIMFIT